MKILHITRGITPELGGPPRYLAYLTRTLAKKGVESVIFSPINKKTNKTIPMDGANVQLFTEDFLSRWWVGYSKKLKDAVYKEIRNFDLVHIHEPWHYPQFVAAKAASKSGKPYIITPHGAFEPYCLKYKALKKRIYGYFIQRKILKNAAVIHIITKEEKDGISNFMGKKLENVELVENGLDIDDFTDLPSRNKLKDVYPFLSKRKIIIYLGRLHPKKGLDILAKSFYEVSRVHKELFLLIVGPDEGGGKVIKNILNPRGLLKNVLFTGMVSETDKIMMLCGADILAIPSYSEVRPLTCLEGMACSLPLVVTYSMRLAEVSEYNAGLVIKPKVNELSEALLKLIRNPEMCKKMGQNGRLLIEKRFSWSNIADKMLFLYKNSIN